LLFLLGIAIKYYTLIADYNTAAAEEKSKYDTEKLEKLV
jgi:hypothetical protein